MHLLSILELSLAEDGPDLTTEGVFGPGDRLQAIIVAKEQTIIAGLPVIPLVMDLCAAHPEELSYTWQSLAKEGEEVAKGSIVARISGPARLLDRVLGRLTASGRKLDPLAYVNTSLAVKAGVGRYGGHNHRRNLAEMLMLKDNHIDAAGSMTKAVELLRGRYNPCPPIEVECRNLDEISEAVACRVDRIMLDNMTPDMLPEALEMIPSFIETEISGGVSLDTIRAYATVSTVRKPDFISVGRITHSAVTADLSMRIAKESL